MSVETEFRAEPQDHVVLFYERDEELIDPVSRYLADGVRLGEVAIVVAASCLFLWLGLNAVVPPLAMNLGWIAVLTLALLVALGGAGWALWRQTRFG